uniref:Uncharacterized protein n=1 Tax=Heliothis virescens TaxID=7102 RepID=A0A2A4JDI7_HELVI
MLSITHFVLLTYFTIYKANIQKTNDADDLLQMLFVILADAAVMVMPMVAGQDSYRSTKESCCTGYWLDCTMYLLFVQKIQKRN